MLTTQRLSQKIPIYDPSAVFVISATACAVEKGNLAICETALDSDFSETGPSQGWLDPQRIKKSRGYPPWRCQYSIKFGKATLKEAPLPKQHDLIFP